jgi:response regulator RpfG family c-di-GMP phosphodiesterase
MSSDELKILTIVDNPESQAAFKSIFEDSFQDVKVFTASNADTGIALAHKEGPTVILLDIVRTGVDAYEVARKLKTDEKIKHIPLIFITGSKADRKNRIKALETGAEAFLTKPLEETELIAQVRAMVKIRTSSDRQKQEKVELTNLLEEQTQAISIELEQRRKAEQETHEAFAKLKQNQLALLLLMEEMKDEISARRKADEDLKQHLTELEILSEFSQTLSQLMTPQQIGQKIIDLVEQKLGWHHIAIRQYHPETDTLVLLALNQPGLENDNERQAMIYRYNSMIHKPGDGIPGWVWQTKKLVRLGNVKQNSNHLETFPGIQSGIYAPILAGEHAIGVISLESEQLDGFNQADERMLTTLTAQAAIALENARLYDQTMSRLKNIESLRQIDRAISSSFDMKSTIAIIAETAQNQLAVSAVDILLYNPQSQMLDFVYGQGFHGTAASNLHIHINEGLAGQVVKDRKIIGVSDLKGINSNKLPVGFMMEDFVSYLGVPLQAKGKVNGVLEIFNRIETNRDQDWFSFLEAFAHQASITIDNARLFDDLQRLNIDISMAYDSTIESWARTMELRDKYVIGHALKVSNMSIKMASALGMDGDSISQIRRGSLLHDIGTLGIPESILLKLGDLTPAEWEIVHRHPRIAYDLLSPLPNWRQAVDIPYYHHERWDGSGYPQGLKGDTIPLSARICAIADVYVALSNERPYRAAWEKNKVLQHISEGAGILFDPDLVRLFLTIFKD